MHALLYFLIPLPAFAFILLVSLYQRLADRREACRTAIARLEQLRAQRQVSSGVTDAPSVEQAGLDERIRAGRAQAQTAIEAYHAALRSPSSRWLAQAFKFEAQPPLDGPDA